MHISGLPVHKGRARGPWEKFAYLQKNYFWQPIFGRDWTGLLDRHGIESPCALQGGALGAFATMRAICEHVEGRLAQYSNPPRPQSRQDYRSARRDRSCNKVCPQHKGQSSSGHTAGAASRSGTGISYPLFGASRTRAGIPTHRMTHKAIVRNRQTTEALRVPRSSPPLAMGLVKRSPKVAPKGWVTLIAL